MTIGGDLDRPRSGPRIFRRRQLPPGLAVAAALLLSACHLTGSYKTGPEGRSMHDTDLRRMAGDQAFVEALDLTDPDDRGEIGDELLRLMHRGLLLHYAGRYEESNEMLQRAEAIIDDRYTKSVSLALFSLVTNDRALAWLPSETERLMVNYYGALNYMALGDPEEAAVEARRLSRLLELSDDEEHEAEELVLREVLRYVAGSVFEASGNRNDAAVAYRHVWSPSDDIAGEPLRPRFLDLYGEDWQEEEPPEPKQDFDTALDSIMATISAGAPQDAGPDVVDGPDDIEMEEGIDLPAPDDTDPALAPPDGFDLPTPDDADPALAPPEGIDLPAPDDTDPDLAPPEGIDLPTPDDTSQELVIPDSLLELPALPLEPGGDVVVLLERGFVAHRVEQSVSVPLFPVEADALHSTNPDVRFAAASCVASRAFQGRYDFSEIVAESGTDWRGNSGGKCIVPGASKASNPGRDLYLMKVAWPEMVTSGLPTDLPVLGLAIAADAGPLRMAALDSAPGTPIGSADEPGSGVIPTSDVPDSRTGLPPTLARPGMRGSVSGAVTHEFEDRLGGIMIKAVARTALKYELARGIEKELDKKNEILGEIAFLTANAAAAMFERADTRSWHLLPDELSVVRLRLPPGVHPLTLQVETGEGGTRLIDLGEVNVRDGSVRVLSARVWP